MDARTRYEAQIKHYQTTFGGEFDDAVTTLAFRNGLSWFTDEQIAEIRDLMVKTEWNRRARMNASRASYRAAAGHRHALASHQMKEAAADAAEYDDRPEYELRYGLREEDIP